MAVKVLTGVKRSSSNNNHSKNPANKRSYLSETQSSITHTGSPVNPMTAKALASKLNERNSILNGAKKGPPSGTAAAAAAVSNGQVNDIPVPPLISIQMTPTTNRFKNGDDAHHRNLPLHPVKISKPKNTAHSNNQKKLANNGKIYKYDTSTTDASSLYLSKSVMK